MKKTEKETTEKLQKLSEHISKEGSAPKKISKKRKPSFRTIEVVVLIFLTAVISLVFGSLVTYNVYTNKMEYSKADSELQSFLETYEEINENYYDDVDKEKLIDGAISGMLGTLDDYSTYYDETAANNLDITLEGEYEGLGIEIYNNESLDIIIASVFEGSPADEAGLKAGDVLVKYGNKSIKETSTSDFVDMVKEDKDGELSLTYMRDGSEKTVIVKQNKIVLRSVASKTFENDTIGYMMVSVFANNTYEQFKKQLEELEKKNIKSLIIDLRSNSGGHLSASEDMISLFLDKTHPIYQIESKDSTKTYYSKGKKDKEYKIVILVNSASASASEILASALKEQHDATLVGVKTYGKGTVQELQTLKNGTKFKITTKKWLTSKGKQIDGKGIEVDVEVGLSDEYIENPTDENDDQLQKALQIANQ